MTPSSSAMDWLLLCSVYDIRNMFLKHLFSNVFTRFVMFAFSAHVWHPCVAVGNKYVRIILNFILLVVAIRSFSMFVNCLHAIASLRLIAFVPSTLTLVGSVHPFTSIIF